MVPRNGLIVANGGDANVDARDRHGLLDAGRALRRDGQRRHRLVRMRAAGRRLLDVRDHGGQSPRRRRAAGRCSAGTTRRTRSLRSLAARHAGVADRDLDRGAEANSAACAGGWKCAASSAASPSTTTSRTIRPRSRRRSTACAARIGSARIVAVLEPRSNTMKLGAHRDALAKSLRARRSRLAVPGPERDLGRRGLGRAARRARGACRRTSTQLVATLGATLASGDHVLIMSNGGFGGIHGKLLERLAKK